MTNVLVTGNKDYGLARSINKTITAEFISRSNGFDLTSEKGLNDAAYKSLDYDVVILCTHTDTGMFSQARLLHKMYKLWTDNMKQGRYICIGSAYEDFLKPIENFYYLTFNAEKTALRKTSDAININRYTLTPNISSTYVGLSHLHTPWCDKINPGEPKLETDYVAKKIAELINSEEEIIENIKIVKDYRNV